MTYSDPEVPMEAPTGPGTAFSPQPHCKLPHSGLRGPSNCWEEAGQTRGPCRGGLEWESLEASPLSTLVLPTYPPPGPNRKGSVSPSPAPQKALCQGRGRGFYSRARPLFQWLQEPPGPGGCLLPAFPHYCSFCGHFPLLRVNQGTFLPCHLPPGDIWQVAPTSLSLSFSMCDVGKAQRV